jgi:hypothetical protein
MDSEEGMLMLRCFLQEERQHRRGTAHPCSSRLEGQEQVSSRPGLKTMIHRVLLLRAVSKHDRRCVGLDMLQVNIICKSTSESLELNATHHVGTGIV